MPERWNLPLTILAVLAVLAAMRMAQEMLIPIVVSVLIAFALDPVVALFEKLGLGRALASGAVLLGVLGAVGGTAYSLRNQALIVLDGLPEAARRMREVIGATTGKKGPIEKVQNAAKEIEKTASAAAGAGSSPQGVPRVQIAEPASRATDYLWWGSIGIASWMGQGVVIFFLVYFLLASGDLYKRKLLKLAGPTLSEKKLSMQILKEIDGQIGRFLLVQIFTSAVVSVVTWLALKWLGVNQPAVWGVAAGVLNSIPYFGAIMVSVGLALVAFVQFGTMNMALYVSGVTFLITSLEGYLLTPALMGKASRINQVALFVGILFWSWMWGVVGMILAVPILMTVRSVADRVEVLWPVAEVLGEKSSDGAGGGH
ncbi:MAG: AI-2E family transporter [Bryobacteraceae bacterium]